MTASAQQAFSVILDDEDDEPTVAEGTLPGADAGPTWAKHRVTIVLDDGDTSGHGATPTALSVILQFDDDVEGHALILHFPNAAKADEFRRKLLATGVVAGALVVGVTAAQLSTAAPTTTTGPIAAPAPVSAPQAPANTRFDDYLPNRMAPAIKDAPAQPQVNPRIPAEDLAPPDHAYSPKHAAEEPPPAPGHRAIPE